MPSAHRRLAVAGALILCVLGMLASASSGSATPPPKTRILVAFKPGSGKNSHNQAINQVNGVDVSTIPHLNVHVIKVPGSALKALTKLKKNGTVKYAEPDSVSHVQESLPSDPSFPEQFSVGGGAWGWYTTHTTQAWDISQGSAATIVAVLDTGLQTQGLNDFSGQVVSGWNVLSGTSDTASQAGVHGTYVAGVVGLGGNNGVGNSGYCPKCSIMPVQVGTDAGALDSDIATGVTWAADHGARVINLSWASPTFSQTLQDAITYAHNKGVLITAAAGNSNCNCETYPAGDQYVMGVAGTVQGDTKSGDSNFGSWVDVAAPESNMTAWPSINGGPGYAPVGGTSLAAPVVAGIAGLIFSANPSLTEAQVQQALETTGVAVPGIAANGRVDALAAMASLGLTDPQASSVPVNTTPASIYYETNGDWNYAPLGTAAPQVGQVLLRGQGAWTGSAPLSVYSVHWLRCTSAGLSCVSVATTAKYTVQAGDAGFAFKVQVTVKNLLGQTISTSVLSSPVPGTAPSGPPANLTAPALTGTAQDGQTIQTTTGSWTNTPSGYTYQWQRCTSLGASCVAITGATAASYVFTSADIGSTIRSQVTATNALGSASTPSTVTAAVAASAPANTAAPTITGTATVGQLLTGANGSWTGTATIAYGDQWLRCDSTGANCNPISTATASTYTLVAADVGSTIRLQVTATNSVGSVAVSSNQTATVMANLQHQSFTGTLSGSTKSLSFSITIGAGESDATLTLSKSASTPVTVQLLSGATVLSSNSGSTTTPITLNVTGLAAGTYTYKVSWTGTKGSLPFTLAVAAPSP